MCIAKDIINNIIELIDSVDTISKDLDEKLSSCDKMEQDILHKIESMKFNACEGYYFSKHLQDIRRSRRDIKNEIITMTCLRNNKMLENLKQQLECKLNKIDSVEIRSGKIYHPRVIKGNTNIVTEIDNLKKLRQVNQSKIKFKPNPEYDRIVELLKQVN